MEVSKPGQRPPLPFLPSPDEGEQGTTVKVKINDDLEERYTLYEETTNENAVALQERYDSLLRKKDGRAKYDGYLLILEDATTDLEIHNGDKLDEDEENKEVEGGDYPRAAPVVFPNTKPTKLAVWNIKLGTLTTKIKQNKSMLEKLIQVAFDLFKVLLGEEARARWNTITIRICKEEDVKETDEDGDVTSTKRGKTWTSLQLCRREFMLSLLSVRR